MNFITPKQLNIRNQSGGMIWQVYHVLNDQEIDMLEATARINGFYNFEILDSIENDEIWPNWRDCPEWTQYLLEWENSHQKQSS